MQTNFVPKTIIMKRFIILTLILFTAFTCDCNVHFVGKVYDKEENVPINGVKVEFMGSEIAEHTDENGDFSLSYIGGSKCYPREIKVTIEGYKPFRLRVNSKGKFKSFEVFNESEFFEFETPLYPDPENKRTFITGTWVDLNSRDFRVSSDSIIFYLAKNPIGENSNN